MNASTFRIPTQRFGYLACEPKSKYQAVNQMPQAVHLIQSDITGDLQHMEQMYL